MKLADSTPLLDDAVALRAQADADGALLLRGLLDPEPVARVRELALAAAAEQGWLAPGAEVGAYDDAWLAVHRALVADPAWAELGEAPPLLGAFGTLFGAPAANGHGAIVRAFAGTAHTTPPHQERAFIGGAADAWTAWIPLGDCPRELGGLAVMPGSHRLGSLPHDAERCTRVPDGEWASADYDAGDVLLLHCLTLHRALPNRSGRLRLSADFRFRPCA